VAVKLQDKASHVVKLQDKASHVRIRNPPFP